LSGDPKKDFVTFAGNLKIFKDKECKIPLEVDEDGTALLGLDIVNAGEVKTVELYIVNKCEHKFELAKVVSADPDVDFEFEGKNLIKDKPVKIKVTFAPKVGRATFLDANFKIKGRFIVQSTAY